LPSPISEVISAGSEIPIKGAVRGIFFGRHDSLCGNQMVDWLDTDWAKRLRLPVTFTGACHCQMSPICAMGYIREIGKSRLCSSGQLLSLLAFLCPTRRQGGSYDLYTPDEGFYELPCASSDMKEQGLSVKRTLVWRLDSRLHDGSDRSRGCP
jgi:hypothetical protein